MATNATEGLSPHDERSVEDLDKRDVRALTEPMTVLPDEGRADGADGLFLVVSHTGNQYLVDTVTGACECPDAEYRDPDGGCKHRRRAEYATGQTAIPSWVDRDAVDDLLGAATDDGPRYAAADGGVIEADDGGHPDDTDPYRPEDCNCGQWNADSGLPCWPCWRDGFRLPPVEDGE
jgi:hypothetical protein